MMCQRIGIPPISTMGFGRSEVSSLNLLPSPPARMTAFISSSFLPSRHPLILHRVPLIAHAGACPVKRPRPASKKQLQGLLQRRALNRRGPLSSPSVARAGSIPIAVRRNSRISAIPGTVSRGILRENRRRCSSSRIYERSVRTLLHQ